MMKSYYWASFSARSRGAVVVSLAKLLQRLLQHGAVKVSGEHAVTQRALAVRRHGHPAHQAADNAQANPGRREWTGGGDYWERA